MTPTWTRVPIVVPVTTDPMPRPPRRPVTPFASADAEYVGLRRHGMPDWVSLILSDAVPVRRFTEVRRGGMSGTTAAVLLMGALALVWLTMLALAPVPAPESAPEPTTAVSNDAPSPSVVPGWVVRP